MPHQITQIKKWLIHFFLLHKNPFNSFKHETLIMFLYALLIFHFTQLLLQMATGIYYLKLTMQKSPNLLFIIYSLAPFALWIWSTCFSRFNYWLIKLTLLSLAVVHAVMVFALALLQLALQLIPPLTFRIPISQEITPAMVVNLTRLLVIICSVIPATLAGLFLKRVITANREQILTFKANRSLDLRKNKQFAYDFKVVTNLTTGIPFVVKEKDRTLHGFANGTTGTAKTSSVLSTAICDDLDQKQFNVSYQKKMCLQYIKKGSFQITHSFQDNDFSINYVEPIYSADHLENKNRQDAYDFLKYVSSSIGLTCIAPNESFSDEIYHMAVSRSFQVNRIDPILTPSGEPKEGFVGFNPLFISPTLTGVNRDIDITNKANIFSDVLQCLYEASGSGDAYFISLNNSVTIAICKLMMITFESLNDRQPTPLDVQLLINDFSMCEPYLKLLVQKYGNNGMPMDEIQRDMIEDRVQFDVGIKQKNINCGLWQDVYTLIQNDLLGPNKDIMFERANGLRLQINKFLNHPLIRRVFSAERTIDLDKALANGEITVVNYALELGSSVSTAFGLFYLLSYSKAVLRRPGTENTRTLHMTYIDELSFLLHPALEEFFSIFRQYKVGNFVAFQTLDQMDKNETTKYLKGVLLGNCAHQIVFGRVSPTEMKIYESMGGKVAKPIEQHTVTQTSMTSDSPNYTYSTRETNQMGNLLEGSQIRNRDFQEVTFFTVNNSSPLPPFFGKVHFLSPRKRQGKPAEVFDWSPFMPTDLEPMCCGPQLHSPDISPFYVHARVRRESNEAHYQITSSGIVMKKETRSQGIYDRFDDKEAAHASVDASPTDSNRDIGFDEISNTTDSDILYNILPEGDRRYD